VDAPDLLSVPSDAFGNAVSGSASAVGHLDDAVDRRLRHDGGVLESAQAAVAADPTFALAHAVTGLADPSDQGRLALARARRLAAEGRVTPYERSLIEFIHLVVHRGLAAAHDVGVAHARAHPRDLLGVGLAATIVERSCRTDVQDAVLAVYEPSRRLLGDHPYLLCMIGFVAQERGEFDRAGRMADQALAAQPSSVTAAHLRAHVAFETADHGAGLRWLDGFRAGMDPRGDYVHHLAWHAALHALALGQADDVLARLTSLGGPGEDPFRQVVDTGTLLMRCRLCGIVGADEDPTHGRGGAVPRPWLEDPASMYLGFHAAVGLAVQSRHDDLLALAQQARRSSVPGVAELLPPLAAALAYWLAGDHARATDGLAALRPTMYRWGGSRAQREVVEDILLATALQAGRAELAIEVLTERIDRRPNRWDDEALCHARGR